jgi:hypothetical protein
MLCAALLLSKNAPRASKIKTSVLTDPPKNTAEFVEDDGGAFLDEDDVGIGQEGDDDGDEGGEGGNGRKRKDGKGKGVQHACFV